MPLVSKEDALVRQLLDATVRAHVRAKDPKRTAQARAEAFAHMQQALEILAEPQPIPQ